MTGDEFKPLAFLILIYYSIYLSILVYSIVGSDDFRKRAKSFCLPTAITTATLVLALTASGVFPIVKALLYNNNPPDIYNTAIVFYGVIGALISSLTLFLTKKSRYIGVILILLAFYSVSSFAMSKYYIIDVCDYNYTKDICLKASNSDPLESFGFWLFQATLSLSLIAHVLFFYFSYLSFIYGEPLLRAMFNKRDAHQ